jgi:hypothetical protein
MKNKTYKYYTDPAHGWLAVKFDDIKKLGIGNQISHFSRYKGNTAYLEQDCDMPLFVRAFTQTFGQEPKITQQFYRTCPIRGYHHWVREYVNL